MAALEEDDMLAEMDLEDEQLLANLGHHPLLERVQATLLKQLHARRDRVEEELREHTEDSTRAKTQREQLGVELYGIQQRLAKLQVKLEETNAGSEAVKHIRVQAEADLGKFRDGYAKRKEQIEGEQARLEALRAELDGLTDALRQGERYSEEQRGKVAVARRETYKAESEVSAAERKKREQDEQLDDLSERIKRLSEQLAILEAQTVSQSRDAAAAEETLREAAAETSSIETEKRQLMSQWRSLLVEMGARDRSLEACHKTLREQEEAFNSLNAEDDNTRKAISKAQDVAASLAEIKEREESAIRFCETSMAALERQREQLEQRQEMLKASLESADAEEARMGLKCDGLRKDIRELEREIGLVQKRRQQAEQGRDEDESAQVTARKAARNLAKSTRHLLEIVHQKELDKAELDNKLARARVEGIEAAARVEALRDELAEVDTDIKEKEHLIQRYEAEIRQRQDSIEKKSALVDRLNRKYEAATRDMPEEEHMGPLHATVHNMTKQIAETRSEVERLQRQWLLDQSRLVDTTADADDKASQMRELESQRVLMGQKRLRLDRAVKQQQEETAEIASGMQRMREDMARINSLISKNDDLRKRLEEATFVAETDFVEGLKELEMASVAAESQIADVKEAKARLLEDLLEAERQGTLLEKKIQLERETQEALDPSVGKSEVAAMEREIHRMELRLESLKRDQERLVGELERAVQMREDIAVRFKSRKEGDSATVTKPKEGGGGLTRAGVSNRLTVVRRQVKERRATTLKLDEALREAQEEQDARDHEAEQLGRVVEQLRAEVEEVQAGVNAAVYDKQKAVETLATLEDARQALVAERQAAEADPDRFKDMAEDRLAATAVEQAEAQRSAIQGAVREMQASLPELAEVLERVFQLTMIVA
jgi:coiled-coil domain-containing protein 40